MDLNENVTVVFSGFLNLSNLQKLQMVEAINEYFDSNHRELIRAENDLRFDKIFKTPNWKCVCCPRPTA